MNLVSSVRIAFETLRVINFAAITSAVNWSLIGTPTANPARMVSVDNMTDVTLIFSLDGLNPHFVRAGNSAKIWDFGSNKADKAGLAELPAFTQVYVRAEGPLPTSGNVYLEVVYLSQS